MYNKLHLGDKAQHKHNVKNQLS